MFSDTLESVLPRRVPLSHSQRWLWSEGERESSIWPLQIPKTIHALYSANQENTQITQYRNLL